MSRNSFFNIPLDSFCYAVLLDQYTKTEKKEAMKKRSYVTIGLGIMLVVFCCLMFINNNSVVSPSGLIGLALIYLGWNQNKRAMIILGHSCIVIGAYLITWGLYLLPVSTPSFTGIIFKPLFWGIFCLFGGICALYHSFCACVINCKNGK